MAAKTLPHEVIAEILCRLPAKDLLRFRSVAKPWCITIDGPDFVKKHLDHSLETASNLGIVIRERNLHWLGLDSLDSVVKLSHPLDGGGEARTELLGSCNGLLALFNSHEDIALWNPWTKRYRNVPNIKNEFLPEVFRYVLVYGFGHDPIRNDYKLVRIIQFHGHDDEDSFGSEVKVYSAKANTWKKISDFPYYLRYNRSYSVLANNALHWVVSRKPILDDSTFVAAFDIAKERCHEIPMPDFTYKKKNKKKIQLNVEVFGGSLCVLCNFSSDEPSQSKRVDIWVMKEYGVRESWTKLFSVSPFCGIGNFNYVQPLAYLKGSNRVLANIGGKRIMTYDLKTKKTENLEIYCTYPFMETLVCVESLVGLGQNGWRTAEESKTKIEGKKKKKQMKKKQYQKRLMVGTRG